MRLKPTEEEIAKHATEKDLKRYKRLVQTAMVSTVSGGLGIALFFFMLLLFVIDPTREISSGLAALWLFAWLIAVPAMVWNIACQVKIDEFEQKLPLTASQYREHLKSTHPGSRVVEAPGGEIWVFTGRFASEAEDGTKYIYERSRDQLEEREKD